MSTGRIIEDGAFCCSCELIDDLGKSQQQLVQAVSTWDRGLLKTRGLNPTKSSCKVSGSIPNTGKTAEESCLVL